MSVTTVIAEREPEHLEPVNPMALLQMAVSQGADVDKLGKLMELQDRWEKREAEKAFIAALAAFKSDPPKILKNKLVDFPRTGGRTTYRHATLDNVCGILDHALAAHGLSYRWKPEHLDSGIIRVTCILTHELGHSTSASLQSVADSSGGKNAIQGVGSTVTYLERYTLLAVCGIAVQNTDDDGRSAETDKPITEQECKELCDALNSVRANFDRFCETFRIADISELKQTELPRAMEMVAKKRGQSK